MSEKGIQSSSLWSPGTSPHGFEVTMLGFRQQPVDPIAAFGYAPDLAYDILERQANADGVRVLAPDEPLRPEEKELRLNAYVAVEVEDYAAAARRGHIGAGLRGRVSSEEAVLSRLRGAFPHLERQAFETGLLKAIQQAALPDVMQFPEGMVDRQLYLTQVVAFGCGRSAVNLYNFTGTHLNADQLGHIASPLREMADRTGAGLFDMLTAMAVLPEDDPLIAPDGNSLKDGRALGGAVMLAEGLFNHSATYYPADYVAPGADTIQRTVFHEAMHVVARGGKVDPGLPIWSYAQAAGLARSNEAVLIEVDEDIAVAAELDLIGAGPQEGLDDVRKRALHTLLRGCHSGVSGPFFVRATELPLPRPGELTGIHTNRPFALRPKYIYTIFDPAATRNRLTRVQ